MKAPASLMAPLFIVALVLFGMHDICYLIIEMFAAFLGKTVLVGSVDELIEAQKSGLMPKFLFFWGHTSKGDGTVGKECLSQWYESEFYFQGRTFPTSEHFMMFEKALMFEDTISAEKILSARSPKQAKWLGRRVKNYDDYLWCNKRFEVVVEANLLKFSKNKCLRDFLQNTGDNTIVEASPVDKVWGIGLAEDHQDVYKPDKWQGQNLLGFALMEVRRRIRANHFKI
ncbi:NADAR family protein [Enterovibrio norvegicus]|uniref:NADAR family protein n=1 Tax=Enterovibrio norvegicus TaxID=188144 RepID=UPI003D687C64